MRNLTPAEANLAKHHLHYDGSLPFGFCAVRNVFSSPACIAIASLQDIHNLGGEGRMNTPATASDNWRLPLRDLWERICGFS